jgi:hypothetical protein
VIGHRWQVIRGQATALTEIDPLMFRRRNPLVGSGGFFLPRSREFFRVDSVPDGPRW